MEHKTTMIQIPIISKPRFNKVSNNKEIFINKNNNNKLVQIEDSMRMSKFKAKSSKIHHNYNEIPNNGEKTVIWTNNMRSNKR